MMQSEEVIEVKNREARVMIRRICGHTPPDLTSQGTPEIALALGTRHSAVQHCCCLALPPPKHAPPHQYAPRN